MTSTLCFPGLLLPPKPHTCPLSPSGWSSPNSQYLPGLAFQPQNFLPSLEIAFYPQLCLELG